MDNLVTIAGAVPVVVGVVQAIKTAGLPKRYAPLLSIVFGVVSAFVFPQETHALTVFAGVGIGLMAAGLYSGVKATIA